jgi:hypothetical protein
VTITEQRESDYYITLQKDDKKGDIKVSEIDEKLAN